MSKPTQFFIGAVQWPGISKLTEECGEVGQVCGKLVGNEGRTEHWDGTNLADRLEEEIADVLAAIDFVVHHNDLDFRRIEKRRQEKLDNFTHWHTDRVREPA